MRMLARRTSRIVIAAAFAATLSLAPAGHAQFGSRGVLSQAFEPYVMQRDLPVLVETLGLEEWQRPLVEALLEDYLASFTAGIEQLRTKMAAAGDSATKGDYGAVLRPVETWNLEKMGLYNKFADLVKSQLSAQQLERWPAWERAIRRERLLPQSEISGEGVNLIGVISDLAPPPEVRGAAAPAIEAYELRIDAALAGRQEREVEMLPAMMNAMATMDHEKAMNLQEKIMAARVAIRDTQELSVTEIATAMGPEWGPKFQALALQRAYPEVYAPNTIVRMYDAALALPELTEEQRTGVTKFKGELEREWETLTAELLSVVKNEEPKGPQRRGAAAKQAAPASTPEQKQAKGGEIEAVRRKRHDIGERYRSVLENLLGPEIYTKLPGAAKYAQEGLGSKFGGGPQDPTKAKAAPGSGGRTIPAGGGKGRETGGAEGATPPAQGSSPPARSAD